MIPKFSVIGIVMVILFFVGVSVANLCRASFECPRGFRCINGSCQAPQPVKLSGPKSYYKLNKGL